MLCGRFFSSGGDTRYKIWLCHRRSSFDHLHGLDVWKKHLTRSVVRSSLHSTLDCCQARCWKPMQPATTRQPRVTERNDILWTLAFPCHIRVTFFVSRVPFLPCTCGTWKRHDNATILLFSLFRFSSIAHNSRAMLEPSSFAKNFQKSLAPP